jgi:hypothetical protein
MYMLHMHVAYGLTLQDVKFCWKVESGIVITSWVWYEACTTCTSVSKIRKGYRAVRCVRAPKGSVVNFTALYQHFIELI